MAQHPYAINTACHKSMPTGLLHLLYWIIEIKSSSPLSSDARVVEFILGDTEPGPCTQCSALLSQSVSQSVSITKPVSHCYLHKKASALRTVPDSLIVKLSTPLFPTSHNKSTSPTSTGSKIDTIIGISFSFRNNNLCPNRDINRG